MQITIKSIRRAPKGGIKHRTGQEYRGGQFIPRDLWDREKKIASEAFDDLVADFGESLQFLRQVFELSAAVEQAGDAVHEPVRKKALKLTTVEARIKTTIRSTYARAFLLGKRSGGNLSAATPSEVERVLKMARGEYPFLRKFLAVMKDGEGKIPYDQRMAMYGRALREPYWCGFLLADASDGRMVRWTYGLTDEHCFHCKGAKDAGEISAREMWERFGQHGILPGSGNLECKGIHCGCGIEEV